MRRILKGWKFLWSVTALAVIALLLPLGIYFYHFHGRYSTHSTDWANFSTFGLAFIGISNAFAIIALTWYFQKHQRTRDEVLQRPIITIQQNADGNRYVLKNIGNGVALNVYTYISNKDDYSHAKFTENRITYSLGRNDDFTRSWLNGELIIIEYMDIFNNRYYSLMKCDRLYLFAGDFSVIFNPDNEQGMPDKIKAYMTWEMPVRTWPKI
jgi:hypothetical protein